MSDTRQHACIGIATHEAEVERAVAAERERCANWLAELARLEKKYRCEFCHGTREANKGTLACHSCGTTGYWSAPTSAEFGDLIRALAKEPGR